MVRFGLLLLRKRLAGKTVSRKFSNSGPLYKEAWKGRLAQIGVVKGRTGRLQQVKLEWTWLCRGIGGGVRRSEKVNREGRSRSKMSTAGADESAMCGESRADDKRTATREGRRE